MLFMVLVCFSILIMMLIRFWFFFRSRSWHGTTVAVITEIEREYRVTKHRKVYYEYPIVTYSIDNITYTEDYAIRETPVGYYQVGQKIPIRYDEKYPRDFVFQDEFRRAKFLITMAGYIGICIYLFFGLANKIHGNGTEKGKFLFQKQTWVKLEESFVEYEDFYFSDSQIAPNELWLCIEETKIHFQRLNLRIDEMKFFKKRQKKYKEQYKQSAMTAAGNLADIYSRLLSEAYEICGLEDEKEIIWQSAYSGFLNQICPSVSPGNGIYSLEELNFMTQIAYQIYHPSVSYESLSRLPEGCIGLELAFSYAKIHSEMVYLACQKNMNSKIEQGFANYIPIYLNKIQQAQGESLENWEIPLDMDEIQNVYTYTIDQYHINHSFPVALWYGAVFASEQMEVRQEAEPSLFHQERYKKENNPFWDFDSQIGLKNFLQLKEVDYKKYSPQYYLIKWKDFVDDLRF